MTFIVSKKHYSDRLLGITPSNVAVAAGPHSPETATVEQILEEGRPWTGLGGTHIVLRGVVTAESIRCHWIGRAFPPLDTSDLWTFITGKETAEEMPAREEIEEILRPLTSPTGEGPVTREGALINHLLEGGYSEDLLQLMCYADYHVNEYLMGTGPEKVTVAYNSIYTEVGWEVLKKASAMAVYTDEKPLDREAVRTGTASPERGNSQNTSHTCTEQQRNHRLPPPGRSNRQLGRRDLERLSPLGRPGRPHRPASRG